MECEPYPPSGQGHNSAQLHRESLWWTLPRCLPTAQLAGRLGLLCPSSSGERTRNASGISVGVQVGAALSADVSTWRSREETMRRPDTSVKEVAEDSCHCGRNFLSQES